MSVPSLLLRTAAPAVWALLCGVWFCTACTAEQFIVPPAAARVGTDPPTYAGCTLEALSAHVSVDGVRLRSAPHLESTILKLLRQGEIHPVVGFDPDLTWAQIQVAGVSPAWVYAELVDFSCAQPVAAAAISPADAEVRETRGVSVLPYWELYVRLLQELREEPESDGGLLYDRVLYVPETTAAVPSPCDVTCSMVQSRQLADGSWFLPYENRYTFDRSSLRVVHLLPLYELHRSGGWQWRAEEQLQYGTATGEPDSGRRVLVSHAWRAARGFADPGAWLPAAGPGRCAYVMDWIGQKAYWQLVADPREKAALTAALAACQGIPRSQPPAALRAAPDLPVAETPGVVVACDARQEVVSIVNRSGNILNLQNWHLHDEGNRHRFQLPFWPLGVDSAVSLGFGGAAADILLTTVPVWNNYGDTVYLYDDHYTLIVAQPCTA